MQACLPYVKYVAHILLGVLGVVEFYLGYVNEDARTNAHKKLRTAIPILIVVICVLGFVSMVNEDAEQADAERNYIWQVSLIQSNQLTDRSASETAWQVGVTNSAAVPAMHSAATHIKIIDESQRLRQLEELSLEGFDLAQAENELLQKRRIEQLRVQKSQADGAQASIAASAAAEKSRRELAESQVRSRDVSIDQFFPYVDYTVSTLRSILVARAQQTGGVLRSNLGDSRELIATNGTCDFEGGAGSPWRYRVSVLGFLPSTKSISIRIECESLGLTTGDAPSTVLGGNSYKITLELVIAPSFDLAKADLRVVSGKGHDFPTLSDRRTLSDYKKAFASALRSLVASHAQQLEPKSGK
ncbi:MAG: hypothetical protein IPK15_10250 [Verrucomicrobia bacterium]|nr:hypothetical protein [Verrucomicrobiota bacterium]